MDDLIRAICQKEGLACRTIAPLGGGQVNRVFLVDGAYVVRVGAREDAFARLEGEADLLRSLAGQVPVPAVLGFGVQAGQVYQVQRFLPGEKLYTLWKDCSLETQDGLASELAAALRVIHARPADSFGSLHPGASRYASWGDLLADKLARTLEELRALNIRMEPGIVELAAAYFEAHRPALEGGEPALVHGDLTLVNLLAERGRLSGMLDFEFAFHAPRDYELWTIEAFCLYPNDYAEEDREIYCAADFAALLPLLRRHYPGLFQVPRLRERVNLYQLDAALGSYLAWRKANLDTIPPERMAGKDFYMARITNFVFDHGVRLFYD
jgi:aminoglycoside phosphotransferase (APT) family kinase protein